MCCFKICWGPGGGNKLDKPVKVYQQLLKNDSVTVLAELHGEKNVPECNQFGKGKQ